MPQKFARAAGVCFILLGLAARAFNPTPDGMIVADLYHTTLHGLFGITLIGFSYRDKSQAGGALLLVALLCMTWTLAGYRNVDSSLGDNRLHGVLAVVLASAAAWHMLSHPRQTSNPA